MYLTPVQQRNARKSALNKKYQNQSYLTFNEIKFHPNNTYILKNHSFIHVIQNVNKFFLPFIRYATAIAANENKQIIIDTNNNCLTLPICYCSVTKTDAS